MPDKREPCSILGRYVGTASGWDQVDDWSLCLYDFEPYEGFYATKGTTLTVDFERGVVQSVSDDGKVEYEADMLETLNRFIEVNLQKNKN